MLIAVSGLAGSGKDSVADVLVKGAFVRVALADPLKRIARDVYDFSDEQLWGPSFKRNEPDERYPREHTWIDGQCLCCGAAFPALRAYPNGRMERDTAPQCYLTPRYALQRLGTEWGRDNFPNTWVNYAVRVYHRLQNGDCYYDQKSGLRTTSFVGEGASPYHSSSWMRSKRDVVISDARFKNELAGIKAAGGKVIRVKRPGVEAPAWQHASETEQMEIPDSEFDYIVVNDGTLEDLAGKVDALARNLSV